MCPRCHTQRAYRSQKQLWIPFCWLFVRIECQDCRLVYYRWRYSRWTPGYALDYQRTSTSSATYLAIAAPIVLILASFGVSNLTPEHFSAYSSFNTNELFESRVEEPVLDIDEGTRLEVVASKNDTASDNVAVAISTEPLSTEPLSTEPLSTTPGANAVEDQLVPTADINQPAAPEVAKQVVYQAPVDSSQTRSMNAFREFERTRPVALPKPSSNALVDTATPSFDIETGGAHKKRPKSKSKHRVVQKAPSVTTKSVRGETLTTHSGLAKRTLPSSIGKNKKNAKSFLGVGFRDPTSSIVTSIHPKSTAMELKIKLGDRLMQVNRKSVTDLKSLRSVVSEFAVGSNVFVVVQRGETLLQLGPHPISSRP